VVKLYIVWLNYTLCG